MAEKRFNTTPKEKLFGNLEYLDLLIRQLPESKLKEELNYTLEKAYSWKPLIKSVSHAVIEKQTLRAEENWQHIQNSQIETQTPISHSSRWLLR